MSSRLFSREGLLRHSILLLVAGQLANVANTLFTMVMGRVMSANDHLEFSILLTMLSLIFIISTPLRALRAAITHFAARFLQSNRGGDILRLLGHWAVVLIGTLLPVILLIVFFRDWVADFFNLPTPYPILVMCVVLLVLPFQPLLMGTLNGIQAFRWLAILMVGWATLRLVAGTALVKLFDPIAEYALAAHALAVACGVLIATFAIFKYSKTWPRTDDPLPGSTGYFFQTCVILTSLSCLMYADMLIVRHFMDDQAGLLAKSSTIGRAVIMLPLPVAMAMFPKVTSDTRLSATSLRTLNHGIIYSLLIMGAAVVLCLALPQLALLVLFGIREPDANLVALVRYTVLAMAPLGMAQLLLNFELAQHRFDILPGCVLSAAVYLVGASIWHETVWQLVTLLAISSFLFLIVTGWTLRSVIRQSLHASDEATT